MIWRAPDEGCAESSSGEAMVKWFQSKKKEPEWQPWVLERPAKQKINWQFWIGSPIALVALIVSVTTGYFTLFYQSDELGVAVSAGPIRFVSKPVFFVPQSMTFINSGTRPLTLLSVSQLIVQPTDQVPEPDCQHGYAQRLALSFELTVVKPNEMVAKTPTSFKPPPNESAMKGQMFVNRRQTNELTPEFYHQPKFFPLESAPQPDPKPYQEVDRSKFAQSRGLLFVVCMTFELVSADSIRWYKTIEVLRTEGTLQFLTVTTKEYPQYLIRRNRFRTLDDMDPPSNHLINHES
jgi:hypothetical protein